jgi:hypothetical protein
MHECNAQIYFLSFCNPKSWDVTVRRGFCLSEHTGGRGEAHGRRPARWLGFSPPESLVRDDAWDICPYHVSEKKTSCQIFLILTIPQRHYEKIRKIVN